MYLSVDKCALACMYVLLLLLLLLLQSSPNGVQCDVTLLAASDLLLSRCLIRLPCPMTAR